MDAIVPPVLQLLSQFIQAPSWAEAQRLVEEHSDLLGDEADVLLSEMIDHPQPKQDEKAVALLAERRALLRRCRKIGITAAFVEKIRTQGGTTSQVSVPVEFQEDLRQSQEDEQRYLRTGDRSALDAAVASSARVLRSPIFATAPQGFQRAAWNEYALVLLRRYWSRGQPDDLDQAVHYLQQAMQQTPLGSPELPSYLNNLGIGLHERFGRIGRLEDLEEAIRVFQQAVAATPEGSLELPRHLNNLGIGLRNRFARTRRGEDLEEAIRVAQQAVAATSGGAPELPTHLNNLGIVLRDRFEWIGQSEDLEEAIRVFQQAVAATPEGSLELPRHLNNLGIGLCRRFEWIGQSEDLEESIGIFQQAVAATPEGSPELPSYLNSLGNGLRDRFRQLGQPENLEEAIRVYQRAVAATPEGSPKLPTHLNNLGNGLRDRFGQTGQPENLEEAIRVYQRAVAATPEGSPKLPTHLNNLGNGLRDRFGQTGQPEDLEEAIQLSQQAVDATPEGSPELPSYLNSLGSGLRDRFGRIGRLEDLEEAIRLYQRAVAATPEESPELPGYLNSLGSGLRDRFGRIGRLEDLEEAIQLSQQAVDATPERSPERLGRLSNLGNGLRDRFGRTGQPEDLEKAIRVSQQGVAATPDGSPKLPMCLNNLGNGLHDRFGQIGQPEDLEEAIRVYQRAVTATPEGSPNLSGYLNNLGVVLRARFERAERLEDLEESIGIFQQAVAATPEGSPELPGRLSNLGNGLRDRFGRIGRTEDLMEAVQRYRCACQEGTLTAPQAALGAAFNWGRWARHRQTWTEVAEAYGYGLKIGRPLLARQVDRAQKESWLRDLQRMPAPAAYALAKLGRLEDAVETVERGRARLLAEALERHRRDLEQLESLGHGNLYRRYQEIVATQERLTQSTNTYTNQPDYMNGQVRLDAIIAADAAFEEVVAAIQKIPGYADFLAEPTFTQIQELAQATPLVYLLTTSTGGLVLIIHNGSIIPIWLDGLIDTFVREWLVGKEYPPQLGGWLGAYRNRDNDATAWMDTVVATTQMLWTEVMGPVTTALRDLQQASQATPLTVTLIPTGLLALLPLHAAWTADASMPNGRRYFLDEFVVRYAPSALALHHASDLAKTMPATHLLAVEQPEAADQVLLPNVHAEVAAITSLFDNLVILAHSEATLMEVQQALAQAEIVHFSCHGCNNWGNPLDSGLLMADDESGQHNLLTVRHLLELEEAGGRLVTLSACETGIIGTELPDEVVALPSALLQTGFTAVVASLWSVPDLSTALLMAHFYQLWHEQGLTPDQALCSAQCWVRDLSTSEVADYAEKCYHEAQSEDKVSLLQAMKHYRECAKQAPNAPPFAHPYYWAAFTANGV